MLTNMRDLTWAKRKPVALLAAIALICRWAKFKCLGARLTAAANGLAASITSTLGRAVNSLPARNHGGLSEECLLTLLADAFNSFSSAGNIAFAAAMHLLWAERATKFTVALWANRHKKRLLSRTVNALAEGAQPTIGGGYNYNFARSNRQATASLSKLIVPQLQGEPQCQLRSLGFAKGVG